MEERKQYQFSSNGSRYCYMGRWEDVDEVMYVDDGSGNFLFYIGEEVSPDDLFSYILFEHLANEFQDLTVLESVEAAFILLDNFTILIDYEK